MRTKRIKIFKFEELSPMVQQAVIEQNRDINSSDNWWDGVYEDAKNSELQIKSFDLDRREIEIDFIAHSLDVAETIIAEHGKETATYKAAHDFLYSTSVLITDTSLKRLLGHAYLDLLQQDYDYLISDEAIKESLVSNEYEYLENGQRYND